MKKLLIAIVLTSALFSCKKAATTPNTITKNTSDTTKVVNDTTKTNNDHSNNKKSISKRISDTRQNSMDCLMFWLPAYCRLLNFANGRFGGT